jgi:UDP-4-amino-4,6-dideoxy-N-acetyl-beta-L-altrosamine transaminase
VKIIPYGRQSIDQTDIDAVTETLLSDYLTQGPKVKEFEEAFAVYVGAKYAVAVSNATAGLHIAVMSLDLKPGERVITSPITFAASANCVRYQQGEVWFGDIDPDTYLLSFDKTKELIESKPRGFFKGIIPVDFAGLPVNLEQYRELADEHGLWIIEDACHAPGGYFIDSKGQTQNCGSANYCDMSVFSFHPVKHIACGEGGMVTTNSNKLYDKLNMLRSHGITRENLQESHGCWYYEMQSLGYNYRLTDIQSALGINQLRKNLSGIQRRIEIAERYKKAFQGKLKFQDLPQNSFNAHHLFVIEAENRKALYDHLKENNVYAQVHYIPVHKLPYYQAIGYNDADLVNSESYYSRCLSLPIYPDLTDEEQEFVIQLVQDFYSNER